MSVSPGSELSSCGTLHYLSDFVVVCSVLLDKMQQYEPQPVSRTYQYRKVMKPMLERKRRARINRCLDELKELMVTALQSDGENVAKLEKADILELTVRHLQRLSRENGGQGLSLSTNNNQSNILNNNHPQQQQQMPASCGRPPSDDRYSEGWASCLKEVAAYLGGGGLDREAGLRLVSHLSRPREISTSQQPVWRPW